MTRHRVSASLHAKVCLGAFVLVFGVMGLMLVRADNALQQSFDTAFDSQAGPLRDASGGPAQANTDVATVSHAESEDYWLGHAGRTGTVPVAWTNSVQIGERIVLGENGERVLRVEDISPMSVGHPLGPRVFIVTAREDGQNDGVVMRFLIEDRTGALSRRAHHRADNRDL